MSTPSLISTNVFPPSPAIPAVDGRGFHTPAWTSFFHQLLGPKVNLIGASYVSDIQTTGQNGIGIAQSQNGNSVSLTFSLGIVTGTSFNGITGLSTIIPSVDTSLGFTGVKTDAARADHSHPLPSSFGTVSSVSVVAANGFTGSVATPTSTPAITIATTLTQGSIMFAGAAGSLAQDNANFFYNPIGYGGNSNMEIGPRGANPLDASYEFYVASGVTAHFHNINPTQSITGGVTVGLMYVPTGSAVTSGNRVGSFEFGGSVDTSDDVVTGAAIRCYSTQGYSASTVGTKMVFQTVPNGSATLTTALTIDQDQSATFTGPVRTAVYAVASLPAGVQGQRAMVNNANATTFNSIVAGGGTNVVPVFFDGTNWRIG